MTMPWSDRTGRRLKPRDLHVFLAVAEAGNIARAAERLGISRPVVSRTISDLEGMLGVQLFDRTARGVEPTRFGEALQARSVAVFDELRRSVEEIAFLSDPNAGVLRIGFSEVAAAGLIPRSLDYLARRYPRMVIRTEQGSASDVLDHLHQRKCELAIVRLAPGDPSLCILPLFHDRLFVVAGARSKWIRKKKVSLRDLVGEPWILSAPELEAGSPVMGAFRREGLDRPRSLVVSNSVNLRFGLLETGRYITIFPGSLRHFAPDRAGVRVLPVDLANWPIPSSAVTLKDRSLSPVAELFLETVRKMAAPLASAE